jgi:hypothetical protein
MKKDPALREELIEALSYMVTRDLPLKMTEADRRDGLANIYLIAATTGNSEEWPDIWKEVMEKTGCLSWAETMKKGMN